MTPSYLRCRAVCARYGIARSTLYEWVKTGRAPRPVQLGPRCVAWSLQSLLAFEQKLTETAQGAVR